MLRVPPQCRPPHVLCTLAVFFALAVSVSAQDVDSRLIDAARSRDTAAIDKLLKQGANVNAKSRNGRTPLMEAASEGYTDVVRLLLQNGAEINARDSAGWTALFWAAFSRRVDTLRALIAKGGSVNAKDGEGRTALFWASSSGHSDVVHALIDHGAHVNARDNYGWTALMSAVDLGQLDTAKVLLEKGADVQVRANDGSTALRLAEKYKYDDLVVLLRDASRIVPAKAPVAPNPKSGSSPVSSSAMSQPGSKKPSSPVAPAQPATAVLSASDILNRKLLQAAEAGDTSEVVTLIRDGAGVNARGPTYGNTALMEASSRGHTDTVRTLLEKGGEVDSTDNAGRTALMEAAFEGYTDTARVLLENGANINAQDNEGWTPLFWAAFSRRKDTVRFLLEKGADVNATNKYQDTALIHAAYGGDTDTVAVLLENHADVNAKDDMGRTALIEAARQGHVDAVRVLLENGADPKVQAKDGSTALSMAEKLHYAEIASLLKNPPVKLESKPSGATSPALTPEASPAEVKTSGAKPLQPASPPSQPATTSPASTTSASVPSEPARAATPPPANPPVADALSTAAQALQKKSKAQAFYRMGLSMRLIEDFWPQNGRIAERAAASILGDLTRVGAPDDLIGLAQFASTQLAVPPEERKGVIPALVAQLRDRLNTYCLAQPPGSAGFTPASQQFFYTSGGLTYDMSLLGQEAAKPRHDDAHTEQTRQKVSPLASNMATQCATISECKIRALAYISDAANIVQQSPLTAADGLTLQKLCDQIGIALGTDEPLTAR